jgi:hypothetical protein
LRGVVLGDHGKSLVWPEIFPISMSADFIRNTKIIRTISGRVEESMKSLD